jgi:fibronectin type 3 domain-containing protein
MSVANGAFRRSIAMAVIAALVGGGSFVLAGAAGSVFATPNLVGTIRNGDTDAPLGGIRVEVWEISSDTGEPLRSSIPDVVTGSDGSFSFDLSGGCWALVAVDTGNTYGQAQAEFCAQPGYDDVVDLFMVPGGSVSGVITDMSSAPISGACASFSSVAPDSYLPVMPVACADAAGAFSTGLLAPGQYRVRFDDPAGAYVGEYYDDEAEFFDADWVTVTAGSNTSGVDATLSPAGTSGGSGTITGTITGDGSGPIAACVTIYYGFANNWSQCTSNGEYTVSGLAAGTYRVYASGNDGLHLGEYYDGQSNFATATAVTVASTPVTVDISLPLSGTISGVVVDEGGNPAEGAPVFACSGFFSCASGVVGADGTYVLGGLTTGSYTVAFGGDGGPWVLEYYDNSPTAPGTPVAVTTGIATIAINATLASTAGMVTGVVTSASSGSAVSGAVVNATPVGQQWPTAQVVTNATGAYVFEDLGAGDYHLGVTANGYVSEYFDGVAVDAPASSRTVVPVVAGATTPGTNFTVVPEASISGRVFAGSPPPSGANYYCAYLTRVGGGDAVSDCAPFGSTYRFGKLAAGDYNLRFSASAYIEEFWNDQPTLATASVITLGTSANFTANATLTRRPMISGVVAASDTGSPLPYAQILVSTPSGSAVASTRANASGQYSAFVSPGTYVVSAYGGTYPQLYASKYWNNAATLASATPVSVGVGSDATSVDFVLDRLPVLTGTITDSATGAPIVNTTVYVYTAAGSFYASGSTNWDGAYSVPLAAGEYKVQFSGFVSWPTSAFIYAEEWHDNQPTSSTATTLSITGPTTVNAQLEPTTQVSGTVTNASTSAPVSGAQVVFTNISSGLTRTAFTTPSGSYQMNLRHGSYRVEFTGTVWQSPAVEKLFERQWYDAAPTAQSATIVTVGASPVSEIDAALTPLAAIRGVVTDSSTGAAVPFARVDLVPEAGSTLVTTMADASGSFALRASPGTYRVFFTGATSYPSYAVRYVAEYHANASNRLAATPVVLGSTDVTGIDAALTPLRLISGTVTDAATGAPIAQQQVRILSATGSFVTSATTNASGFYSVFVAPGVYLVEFSPINHVREFHPDAPSVQAAGVVTVSSTDVVIDEDLDLGGSVAGSVVDAQSGNSVPACISVYTGPGVVYSNTCDWDGDFTFGGLPPGEVRIVATQLLSSAPFQMTWYSNGTSFESASPVQIVRGASIPDIDIVVGGGGITGTLVDSVTGSPISGARVYYGLASNTYPTSSVLTTSTGSFSTSYLPPGNYRLSFSAAGYAAEFYDGAALIGDADPITVAGSTVDVGVVDLAPAAATISGVIVVEGTSDPAPDVCVTVTEVGNYWNQIQKCTPDGSYSIGLRPGSYEVYVSGSQSESRYLSDWLYTWSSPLVVTAGTSTPSFAIELGGRVSGRITDATTGAPLQGVVVYVQTPMGYFYGYTDNEGVYTTNAAPAGSHIIRFENNAGRYIAEYYDDEFLRSAANSVAVSAGADTTNVDAVLTVGTLVRGTVRDARTGLPLAGACVHFETPTGEALGSRCADGAGRYLSPPFPPGDYVAKVNLMGYKPTQVTATLLSGADTSGADIAARPYGFRATGVLTGLVGPASGICVTVHALVNGPAIGDQVCTGVDGQYSLDLDEPGTYQLRFADAAGQYQTAWRQFVAESAGADSRLDVQLLPLASPPGAPGSLAAVPGAGQVVLTWSAPTWTGGSPITDYKVYRSSNGGASYSLVSDPVSTATTATVTGLSGGTEYTFRIRAVNAHGDGTYSATVVTTPTSSAPSAPTALTATPGGGQVALTWSAPASNGGSAITDYLIYRSSNGGVSYVLVTDPVSAARSFTATGLTGGVAYRFRVRAVNAVGLSNHSSVVTATPSVTVPSAPLSLAGTPGPGSVGLTWSAPASNGGSAITDYLIYRSSNGGVSYVLVSDPVSTARSFTVTGLVGGTGYRFRVRAVTAAGLGTYSSSILSVPLASSPSAPTGLTATAGSGSVALSWSAPANNGGSAITDYLVYRSSNGGVSYSLVSDGLSTATSATVSGLVPGVTYLFRVRAVNAIGQGTYSVAVSGTTVAPTPSTTTVAPTPSTTTVAPTPSTTSTVAPTPSTTSTVAPTPN